MGSPAKCKKSRFNTKLDCEIALSGIHGTNTRHRHRKFREEPTACYWCPFCEGWHMTKQSESQDRW